MGLQFLSPSLWRLYTRLVSVKMGRWSCVERLASEVTYDQKPIEELCGKRRLLKIVPGNSVLYVMPHTKGSH